MKRCCLCKNLLGQNNIVLSQVSSGKTTNRVKLIKNVFEKVSIRSVVTVFKSDKTDCPVCTVDDCALPQV